MKKIHKIALAFTVLCLCFSLAACTAPQTKDTSAVAGTYYQHDGNDAEITQSGIILNDNGTWTTVAKNRDSDTEDHNFGTFTLTNTNEIAIYSGNMKVMHGTIENNVITLSIWLVTHWEDGVKYYISENTEE